MGKHILKFYPVGNGDTTFLRLNNKSTILIDCKIRNGEEDASGNTIYDVKNDLLDNLEKRDSNPFLDLFILTHPDEDHCLGYEKNFYTGSPDNYSQSNRDNDEIMVDELWVTSSVFNDDDNSDAKALKKEAERRRKLYQDDDSNKNKVGNKLRIIGYDGDERFESVPNSIPGEILTLQDINGSNEEILEIFIHAPFKKSLIDSQAVKDKNSTSIVLQIRLKEEASQEDWDCFILTGGDADHYRWDQVLQKSKDHENEDRLEWNIFQSPHHCSWSFFNDVPYENDENKEPKESSLEILDYQLETAYIVASSKKVLSEKPNPPHQAAKDEYLGKLGSEESFLNTGVYPEENEPKPIIFEIGKGEIVLVETSSSNDDDKIAESALKGASVGYIRKPWRNDGFHI